jgi:F-type H+-transporting ATPase subunit delta
VAREFEQFWMQQRGIRKALVFSVIPLSEEQSRRLHAVLEERLKTRLVLENVVDRSLLAGIAIQIGSSSFDFSLNRRINSLKESVLGEN